MQCIGFRTTTVPHTGLAWNHVWSFSHWSPWQVCLHLHHHIPPGTLCAGVNVGMEIKSKTFHKTSLRSTYWEEVDLSMRNPRELVECGMACAKVERCDGVLWDMDNHICSLGSVSFRYCHCSSVSPSNHLCSRKTFLFTLLKCPAMVLWSCF